MQTSSITHWLPDADATRAAGLILGRALRDQPANGPPLLVVLRGELGAGKTTLVGGLLAALGHAGPVRSPTYTLIEPYEIAGEHKSDGNVARHCYHLDLYRLVEPLQLEELGFRDLLEPGALLLVEWPERAEGYLSPADLEVRLSYPPGGVDGRELCLTARGESQCALVDRLVF